MKTAKASIIIDHLSKSFGKKHAVSDIHLTIYQGEVTALIGENGAGKTTLLKMLVGLLSPTSGTATLMGKDIQITPVSAKQTFGYVSDDPSAYDYLTGREFLTLTARLRRLPQELIVSKIAELTSLFPIAEIMDEPMNQYSRGSKQKVAFLASLISEPDILIIDEPIVGMDTKSIDILGKKLQSYATQGHTVFLVTHILDFAQRYAHRALIMNNGSITKDIGITKKTILSEFV